MPTDKEIVFRALTIPLEHGSLALKDCGGNRFTSRNVGGDGVSRDIAHIEGLPKRLIHPPDTTLGDVAQLGIDALFLIEPLLAQRGQVDLRLEHRQINCRIAFSAGNSIGSGLRPRARTVGSDFSRSVQQGLHDCSLHVRGPLCRGHAGVVRGGRRLGRVFIVPGRYERIDCASAERLTNSGNIHLHSSLNMT